MISRHVIVFTLCVMCAYAQVSLSPLHIERIKLNPHLKFSKQARHPRDITWDRPAGNGKVFGTLGGDDSSVYGKVGYKGDIFNDNRGILKGEGYGSRVIGPYGGSSHVGGNLDWTSADKTADAALGLDKQIRGRTKVSGSASKVWNWGKNTQFSAGGVTLTTQ